MKRLGLLYINSDWGRTSEKLFTDGRQGAWGRGGGRRGLPSPTTRISAPPSCGWRDAKPDSIALVSYYPDGAQIGAATASGGCRSAGGRRRIGVIRTKFLELGGAAANGVYTDTNFFPADPRPAVQDFVRRYRAKFGDGEPDAYVARGYDALMVGDLRDARIWADATGRA